MGMTMDSKERTRARNEQNKVDIEHIKLYTLTDCESILGVTHRTLQTYVKTGKLKARKIGGKWKVTKETLEEFIEQ